MSEDTGSVSKGIAFFWCLVLFALSYGIFTYSPENRPWWLTAAAYLAAFLAFGAFVELVRGRRRRSESGRSAGHQVRQAAGLSEKENDLVGQLSEVLEQRQGFVGRESDLPGSREELQQVLLRAKSDPIYQFAPAVIETALCALDTFVPDSEFEAAKAFIEHALERAAARDEEGFDTLCARASEAQRKALASIARTMENRRARKPGAG